MTPHVQTYCSPSTLTNMEEVKVVVLHKTLRCFWRFFQQGAHIPCSYVDGSFVVPESSDSNSGLPKIGVHLTDVLIILTFDLILMINIIVLLYVVMTETSSWMVNFGALLYPLFICLCDCKTASKGHSIYSWFVW